MSVTSSFVRASNLTSARLFRKNWKETKKHGVLVTKCYPICALQACVGGGFQVVGMEDVVSEIDMFNPVTGHFNIITLEHMKKMKINAIVGNIGHFDNKIDMAGFEGFEGIKVENIKPQVDRLVFPDGHGVRSLMASCALLM